MKADAMAAMPCKQFTLPGRQKRAGLQRKKKRLKRMHVECKSDDS